MGRRQGVEGQKRRGQLHFQERVLPERNTSGRAKDIKWQDKTAES